MGRSPCLPCVAQSLKTEFEIRRNPDVLRGEIVGLNSDSVNLEQESGRYAPLVEVTEEGIATLQEHSVFTQAISEASENVHAGYPIAGVIHIGAPAAADVKAGADVNI